MPEQDSFDPRDYLLSGDWHTVLAQKGWEAAPQGIKSVKKTYRFPKGWFITVWVEEEKETEDFVTFDGPLPSRLKPTAKVVAYGPHGNALGGLWCTDDAVPKIVADIEELVQQFRTDYKGAGNAIGRLLGNAEDIIREGRAAGIMNALLEAEDDFDVAGYMADEFTDLMRTLGYTHVAERSYAKPYTTPLVDFKVYYDGVADEKRFLSPGEGRYRGQMGGILIDARMTEEGVRRQPDLPNWMRDWTRQNYRSLLNHAFDHDPPLDVVTEVDKALKEFTGTIDDAEVMCLHLKERLRASSTAAWKARTGK